MTTSKQYYAHNVTRRKPPMPFNTYIEDKAMIPVLLGYDWIVSHGTWTDCPYETYVSLKKKVIHNGNAKPLA